VVRVICSNQKHKQRQGWDGQSLVLGPSCAAGSWEEL